MLLGVCTPPQGRRVPCRAAQAPPQRQVRSAGQAAWEGAQACHPVFCINIHKPRYGIGYGASPEERPRHGESRCLRQHSAEPRCRHGVPVPTTPCGDRERRPVPLGCPAADVTCFSPVAEAGTPPQHADAACARPAPTRHTAHTVMTTACSEAHDFSAEDGWSDLRAGETRVTGHWPVSLLNL